MAGLIKREDIDLVRERSDLKEIVDAFVTLRSAGVGSYKGLCPFHDERSPSFHVRPSVGTYHCFGCGESGDAIAFLMKMEHTTFAETVERLAARANIELHYEDGGSGPDKEQVGRRQRLLEANKIADEYFREQLGTSGAATGQQFLAGRGFTSEHAQHFGVGYAPQGWDNLLKHLQRRGFREDELRLTGLFSEGQRGIYDRFRGRLVWPIRDMTGATIGFGARKLFEDDPGPKYLNTPETGLYKKSQVLYGIDLAKRNIAKKRQLVVVEGYTDVMAAHLSGVDTAVATCGTAFGSDHVKIARRLISDDGTGGEIIFTFDGDAAGQKAALRAFEEDNKFLAKTFVAVEPSGMDPCDLRQDKGPEAVVALIDSRRPLFEFAIKAGMKNFNLDTVEGRTGALRHAAPIVAGIRDSVVRPGYERELAGWLGMEPATVHRAVQSAQRAAASPAPGHRRGHPDDGRSAGHGAEGDAGRPGEAGPGFQRPDVRDPAARMEKEALEVVLQQPTLLSAEQWQAFYAADFKVPAYAVIHSGIRAAGMAGATPSQWVEQVRQEVPVELGSLVSELAVTPLPARTSEDLVRYCRDIMNRLFELQITHRKGDLMGRLQRLGPQGDPAEFAALNRQLVDLEMKRRSLRARD
ncbi:DNA primase [Citricoccus zhacaiensis]|uniref:DNA primase n=1 Tax=Citricoccus zhacaiensis TaxID=489142 RepID=A0ABQ2LNK4_9MICC|nr:DNA primase [Citricoccus zhacaiensis]GGO40767.1 DNA primase [Citricoccus zhacaiensis]